MARSPAPRDEPRPSPRPGSGRKPPPPPWVPRGRRAAAVAAKGDRVDATDEVAEGAVGPEVVEGVGVRGALHLHGPRGDGPCGRSLELAPDLVYDDRLVQVVLHRLDHHRVLL